MNVARFVLAATVLTLMLFLSAPQALREALATAPPQPSGATAPTPPNHSFDSGSYQVGTPPANHDFPDDAFDVGTPPTNHDFETGNGTGWTLDFGTASVESGGPTGYYLKLSGGSQVTSSDFTVPSNAQTLTFDFSRIAGSGTLTFFVIDAATRLTIESYGFDPYSAAWTDGGIPVETSWSNRNVALQIYASSFLTTIGLDNIGVMRHLQNNWKAVDTGTYTNAPDLGTDAPQGNYALLPPNSAMATELFTISDDAQEMTHLYSILNGPASYSVVLAFSGHSHTLFSGTCLDTSPTPWTLQHDTVVGHNGQLAQLQIIVNGACSPTWGSLAIDVAGVTNVVFSEWNLVNTVTGSVPWERRSDGPWGDHARMHWGPIYLSDPFTVPPNATSIAYKRKCETTDAALIWTIKILTGPDAGQDVSSIFLGRRFCDNPGELDWHTVNIGWGSYIVAGEQVQLEFTVGASDASVDIVRLDEVSFNLLAHLQGEGVKDEKDGDPVSVVSGAFTHSHTDVAIPGKGIPLGFTRYYSSQGSVTSELGYRWSHTYAMSLTIESDGDAIIQYPPGYTARFDWDSGTETFTAPTGNYDTLVKNVDSTYTLSTKAQVQFNFSSAGALTSIVDRNNNTTTLTYTAGRLTSVTDPGGRSLTFSYDDPAYPDNITKVTDPLPAPDTRTVEFTYDANGDLTQVQDVKGGTTTYVYSNHRMTSLTDANRQAVDDPETLVGGCGPAGTGDGVDDDSDGAIDDGCPNLVQSYDNANRVVEQSDALGGVTCIYYGTGPTVHQRGLPRGHPGAPGGPDRLR